ncbi:MAG: hypothetical protein K0Q51_1146, partial [Rickettsiaceae bacterium]|nr:hypothetical protein [Rickettsiaceae bacterium]
MKNKKKEIEEYDNKAKASAAKKKKLDVESNAYSAQELISLLKTAINNDDIQALEEAISLGADINEEFYILDYDGKRNFKGMALHYAAFKGKPNVTRYLLEIGIVKGPHPNQADKLGITPLLIAATMCHVEVVKLLLDKGVTPNQASEKTGNTPLLLAAQ